MQDWTEADVQEAARRGDTFCVYAYTPMCGTCQVASKMLTVSLELIPQLMIGRMNINFFPNIAKHCEIESVPCLLLYKKGKLIQKIYAFQSVPYLYTTLKEFSDS